MKIHKKIVVTIELEEHELITLERERNFLDNLPTKQPIKSNNQKLIKQILEAILEE